LQNSIQSALDEALGSGRAIVRAHIDVDGSTNVQRETKRAPLADRAIAGQTIDERYSSDKKRYVKTELSSDRGSDLVVTEKGSAAGRPQRVSIAVFLDRALAGQIPMIRSLIENAGGVDYARGDRVSVQPIALAATTGPAPGRRGASPTRMVLASFQPMLAPTIMTLAVAGFAPAVFY
jgi:flagellar biosynthesis/type III secretory pathway M-ring protein FliF/YscJ